MLDTRPIAVFFLLLFLSGCAATPPPASNSSPFSGGEGGLGECLDSCRGISGRMLDSCRIGCYIVDAKSTLDPASCYPIRGYVNASMYYSSCLGNVAGLRGNVSPCDMGRNLSEKEWCLLTSAERIKDPGICDPINDSVIKGACVDSASTTLH